MRIKQLIKLGSIIFLLAISSVAYGASTDKLVESKVITIDITTLAVVAKSTK